MSSTDDAAKTASWDARTQSFGAAMPTTRRGQDHRPDALTASGIRPEDIHRLAKAPAVDRAIERLRASH